MVQEGEPYMVYLAAKDGKVGELKVKYTHSHVKPSPLESKDLTHCRPSAASSSCVCCAKVQACVLERVVSRILEISQRTPAYISHVQTLLQNKLTEARLLECQKGQDTPRCCIAADYLEHVDVKTGFTPLLAAVFWHRAQAARLVSGE